MIKLAIPRQRGGYVPRPIRGPLSARQQFVDNTMRASLHTTALTALTLIASSVLATAAEVRVLTVGSTQLAAKAIATDFEKQTRNQVTFTIRPPFDIDKELAAKTFDAIILSVPAMDNHDEAGDLAPMSRVALARVGVGVVVKEGGPVPDVSTPEKLKAAVLTARSLTYTDPAAPNTSGAIAGAALAKLGILDEIKGKTRHAALAVGRAHHAGKWRRPPRFDAIRAVNLLAFPHGKQDDSSVRLGLSATATVGSIASGYFGI